MIRVFKALIPWAAAAALAVELEPQQQREQGLRRLAKSAKVVVCHRAADGSLRTIQVSENAVWAHEAHGDVIGTACEDLSCAQRCHHEPCMVDFVEDEDESLCTCLDVRQRSLLQQTHGRVRMRKSRLRV